jgi:DNA-binding CsgD family transcriptional regulator
VSSVRLIGRTKACAQLDDLLAGANRQRSGVLVIEGDPGIGKTALLDYAISAAAPMSVVKARGVQSEFDLHYGGLGRLLRPLRNLLSVVSPVAGELLSELITPHGFQPSRAVDRFAVGAATLALLAAAAEATPLLVVVDDVQWLDQSSVDALAFAGRRLEAEGIVLLLARRSGEGAASLEGFAHLALDGLDASSAALLLAEKGVAGLDSARLDWVTAETSGNPLALVELPALLDLGALPDATGSYQPLPLGARLQEAYGSRTGELPAAAQEALLVAALLDDSDSRLLHAALGQVGRSTADLVVAEERGLVSLGVDGVAFRHPLVRSAVTQGASPTLRRRCHQAIAEALLQSSNPDDRARRAWHLAFAAPGLDEGVASLLARVGERAQAMGGFSSASHAYERAAHLSYDRVLRSDRYLLAAEAAYMAGLGQRCQALLDQAAAHDPQGAADIRVVRVQSRLDTFEGRPRDAYQRLLTSASRTGEAIESAQLLLDAVVAAAFSGDTQRAMEAATEALRLSENKHPYTETTSRLAVGAAYALRGDADRAIPLFGDDDLLIGFAASNADALPYLSSVAFCDLLVDRFEATARLTKAIIGHAETQGITGALPFALTVRASANYELGAWESASADAYQAAELAADTGRLTDLGQARIIQALVAAGQGRTADCDTFGRDSLQRCHEGGAYATEARAHIAFGLSELGQGRPVESIPHLENAESLCRSLQLLEPSHWPWAIDLVEARVRAEDRDGAAALLEHLEWNAERSPRPIVVGQLYKARGLLSSSSEFADHFEHALVHYEKASRPFELARTQFAFGERLRRAKQKAAARRQLAAALKTFTLLGAVPWADRTRAELEATGANLPEPQHIITDILTPQELQIALTISDGTSNREAATRLFLSRKTIEYHLSHVYRKLDVRTRQEMATVLADHELVRTI